MTCMRNFTTYCLGLVIATALFSSCVKDPKEKAAAPPVVSDSWREDFDDAGKLGGKGWVITNNSEFPGTEAWRQGRYESTNKATFGFDYVVGFPAFSATKSPNDFVSCDMYAGTGVSNLSVWLISPAFKMKNGDQLTFYTRDAVDEGSTWLKDGTDRLEVRANITNGSTNTGKLWTDVGDFSSVWLQINPNLTFGGYPSTWTKFTITLAGITGTVKGRIAFRYFVANGGPDGVNAGLVGIDALQFVSK